MSNDEVFLEVRRLLEQANELMAHVDIDDLDEDQEDSVSFVQTNIEHTLEELQDMVG